MAEMSPVKPPTRKPLKTARPAVAQKAVPGKVRAASRSKAKADTTSLDKDLGTIDSFLAGGGLSHGHRHFAGVYERQTPIARLEDERKATPRNIGVSSRRVGGRKQSIPLLQVDAWKELPWLLHGFTAREGGVSSAYNPDQGADLNLGFTAADERENVEENRRRLITALAGKKKTSLVVPKQIHSNLMRRVTKGSSTPASALPGIFVANGTKKLTADGVMTDEPGLLLGVLTADCVPVLIVDVKQKAVAAFHAGWRGTLKRIVEQGVGRMRLEFGSKPKNLRAVIGPCIGQCCYSVGDEVLREFESQFAYARDLFCEIYDSNPIREKYPLLFLTARAPGHSPIGPSLHLDLAEANRRQLLDAGLAEKHISMAGVCTSCGREQYFSHRAESGHAGRMMAVVGVV